MAPILTILSLAIFVPFVVSSYVYPAQCKIAFRLDDIQDGWLVSTQMAVIDKFLAAKIPLTIGIVDNLFGLQFDPSSQLVPYLQTNLASGLLEVAFHSPNHLQVTLFNLTEQQAQLAQGQSNLYGPSSKLPSNPHPMVSFIPPYNFFDGNTLTAMRNLGYQVLSSSADPNQCDAEGIEFYNSCSASTGLINSIYHWPEHAATADDSAVPYTASDTITLIRQQLTDCNGFSVVMLHFVEFFDNSTQTPDSNQLAQLDLVLAEVNSSGCELRFLRTLKDPYSGQPTEAPTEFNSTAAPTEFNSTAAPTDPNSTFMPTMAPTHSPVNTVSCLLLAFVIALSVF